MPTREIELAALRACPPDFPALVAGIDEVGRGALAGPVSVGIALVDGAEGAVPAGLTDSKQLSEKRREEMFNQVAAWVKAWEVASASPGEIDTWGIVGAIKLATYRGLQRLAERGFPVRMVLLDGNRDWVSPGSGDLFQADGHPDFHPQAQIKRQVKTFVKGDSLVSVISAASILAKVSRDRYMRTLADPGYQWAKNKGYAAAAHLAGIKQLGLSDQHRKSWNLSAYLPE